MKLAKTWSKAKKMVTLMFKTNSRNQRYRREGSLRVKNLKFQTIHFLTSSKFKKDHQPIIACKVSVKPRKTSRIKGKISQADSSPRKTIHLNCIAFNKKIPSGLTHKSVRKMNKQASKSEHRQVPQRSKQTLQTFRQRRPRCKTHNFSRSQC